MSPIFAFPVSSLLVLFAILLPGRAHSDFKEPGALHDVVYRWLHWGANLHDTQQIPPAPHPRALLDVRDTVPPSFPSYIIGAASSNHTSHFPLDYSLQMMHRSEVDLIASYLRPTDVYLEYGSGGSTYNFAPLVARAYSIEHNCEWANFVSRSLKRRPHASAYTNLHMRCVSVLPGFRGWGTLSNFEHANYVQFREYVDAVDTFREPTFDRVFIDGRASKSSSLFLCFMVYSLFSFENCAGFLFANNDDRPAFLLGPMIGLACALKILPYLKPDSLVFIHDFYSRSKHYSAMLRYYIEVARVLAWRNQDATQGPIDEPQGLVVLRRADNVTGEMAHLNASAIDMIYESIQWHEPFGPPLTSMHGYVTYIVSFADFGKWSRARSPRALVYFVRKDMMRVVMLYIIAALVVTAYRRFVAPSPKAKQEELASSMAINTGMTSAARTNEPRFIETEAMKAASARRKRASMSSSQLSV